MRKQRDGKDTKERVLQAAQATFAAKGFAGSSLGDISRQCGISDGLILHHFKSKKNLYGQVLERQAQEYTQVLSQASEAAASPREMMQKTLAASFNYWKQDSTYERISLWAYLEGENEFAEKEARLTVRLARMMEEMQAKGVMDNRFAPMVLLTFIIGPIHFWLRYRDRFKEALKLEQTADELDQLFLEQLVQLIMEMSKKSQ